MPEGVRYSEGCHDNSIAFTIYFMAFGDVYYPLEGDDPLQATITDGGQPAPGNHLPDQLPIERRKAKLAALLKKTTSICNVPCS
jgi:hypothetical protein